MIERRSYSLPERQLVACIAGGGSLYSLSTLRKIANDQELTKRRKFYRLAYGLAMQYRFNVIIEEDLANANKARKRFKRSIKHCLGLLECIDAVLSNRCDYSYIYEADHRASRDLIDLHALHEQLNDLLHTTMEAEAILPKLPSSRRPRLALRAWVKGHLAFWTGELGKPVTVAPDKRDGMSRCHRYLHDLLVPLDPSATEHLRSILREHRTSH